MHAPLRASGIEVQGLGLRQVCATFGVLLSMGDLASDQYIIFMLFTLGHYGPACVLSLMVCSSFAMKVEASPPIQLHCNIAQPPGEASKRRGIPWPHAGLVLQALLAVLLTKHRSLVAAGFEVGLVLTSLKPVAEVVQLAHGEVHDAGAPAHPKVVMIMRMIIERVFSVPMAIVQTVTLLNHADARSPWALASILLSCLTTAFVATMIAYNKDTSPAGRHSCPAFNGCAHRLLRPWTLARLCSRAAHVVISTVIVRFMGNTPIVKTRRFCVLLAVHVTQVVNRTITLVLLGVTQPWWAVAYLLGDFFLLAAFKALRNDIWYWPPGFGVPLSLLARFASKCFTDSTACAFFRHPLEIGGLSYTFSAVTGQARPLFAPTPRSTRARAAQRCRSGASEAKISAVRRCRWLLSQQSTSTGSTSWASPRLRSAHYTPSFARFWGSGSSRSAR